MSKKFPELSIVIPVYNSENTLHELYKRLSNVLDKRLKKTFEIILVDDASRDNSWHIMEKIRKMDSRVKIIRLIRNFGQHNATICGFRHCAGKYIITMDDDLQHPPEELPKLLSKIEDNYDVVIGSYAEKKHTLLRKPATELIDYLHNSILRKPNNLRFTSLKLYRRNVVQQIIADDQSSYCYITASILKYVAPDRITNVQVIHHQRKIGRSNYTILKMLSLASNLLINYSAIPLRLTIYAGFALSGGCILYAVYLLLRVIFGGPIQIAGWASLAFLTTFLFGMLFLFLGIIGEYIFRILREVSGNEPYIIKEIRGFNPGSPNRKDTAC